MSDWYDIALDEFIHDVSMDLGIESEVVESIYSQFYNYGVIDYDVMKEFLQETYQGSEEDE